MPRQFLCYTIRKTFRNQISLLTNKRGVIILEYTLLLVTCVTMALILTEVAVLSNDPNAQGWVIKRWWQIMEVIANDT